MLSGFGALFGALFAKLPSPAAPLFAVEDTVFPTFATFGVFFSSAFSGFGSVGVVLLTSEAALFTVEAAGLVAAAAGLVALLLIKDCQSIYFA